MQRIRKGFWVSEELLEERRRNYFASKKSMFQWFKSFFERGVKEKSEPK